MQLAHFALVAAAAAGCTFTDGNYYCSQTSKITYQNVGFQGSYQDVVSMDEGLATCQQQPYSFSGLLAPLDEELLVHFRGPIKLLQFGVYYPLGSANQKRLECNEVQHVHHRHVKRATAIVTETVVVNQNGQPVSDSVALTQVQSVQSLTPSLQAVQPPVQSQAQSPQLSAAGSTLTVSTVLPSAQPQPPSAPAGSGWTRALYFSPNNAQNCTFLNYFGGLGLGVWLSAFGNSLSYASADMLGASSSPVAFNGQLIGSNKEFVVMSGLQCQGNSCGFYRPGIPAYHGFGGKLKIFVFEFEMPSDSGASGFNADMPAVWLLNAKIPRTLQYGAASCLCWKTGCGEMDLFEILTAGLNKLISHLHDGQGANGLAQGGGGSQDYFLRPTSGLLKAAVVFDGSTITIVEVTDSFDEFLSAQTVEGWLAQAGSQAQLAN